MASEIRLLVFALAYIPRRCRPVPLKRRYAMALMVSPPHSTIGGSELRGNKNLCTRTHPVSWSVEIYPPPTTAAITAKLASNPIRARPARSRFLPETGPLIGRPGLSGPGLPEFGTFRDVSGKFKIKFLAPSSRCLSTNFPTPYLSC